MNLHQHVMYIQCCGTTRLHNNFGHFEILMFSTLEQFQVCNLLNQFTIIIVQVLFFSVSRSLIITDPYSADPYL